MAQKRSKGQNVPKLPFKGLKSGQFDPFYIIQVDLETNGQACLHFILRPKYENGKIPKLQRHLVAKPNGGFWVDSILLHHTTSTFYAHSHTKISASKVCHVTENV